MEDQVKKLPDYKKIAQINILPFSGNDPGNEPIKKRINISK